VDEVRALQAQGNTVMYLAVAARRWKALWRSPIRSRHPQRSAVKALHGQGCRIVMATGDNEVTAGP
jgi:cation transport ATPase